MFDRLRSAQREDSGFTLVELLVVIAILGVLASVVVFSVAGIQDNSQKSACQTEAQTVRAAQEAYYAKTSPHVYATSWTTLTTSPNKLLNNSPTLVDFAATSSASSYVPAWTATCSSISGVGNP